MSVYSCEAFFIKYGMNYLFIFSLIFFCLSSNAQSSFSKKYKYSQHITHVKVQENRDFFLTSGFGLFPSIFDRNLLMSSIDKNNGSPIWSHSVTVNQDNLYFYYLYWFFENKDNNEDFDLYTRIKKPQGSETNGALFFGNSTGFTNAVLLPEIVGGTACGIQKDNIIALAGNVGADSISVIFFNQAGELLHQRNYLSQLLFNEHFYDIEIYEDDFYLAGSVGSHSYLLKDKIEGGEFIYKIFDRILLEQIEIDAEGNIYAAAVETYYIAGEKFIRNRHLFKLNSNLEVLWTKTLEGLPGNGLFRTLEITEGGEIIISFAAIRNLVNYHFRFNKEGDLLFKKGIPIGDLSRWSQGDSSIMIGANRFYDDSPLEDNEFIIAKTDANIELPDCPTYDVCIEMTEGFEPSYFDLTFMPFEYTMEVQPLSIISEPIEFEVEDICYTIPPPRADFILPDTLCGFDILLPTDVFNDTAEELNWQIRGGGVDTIFTEFPEDYSLNLPGDYEVTQTVSFFGCTESYTRALKILEDLEMSFDTDSLICDSPPLILSAEGNRPLVDFLWDDSVSTVNYEIFGSGSYGLIASDGYCKDTIEQFLRFIFPEGFTPEFSAGNDTLVCFDSESPFILRPTSNFTEFFRNNDNEDSTFVIQNEGTYIFEAVIDESCIFSDEIQIESADCRSSIFLANVFSPNEDSINDTWKPQGKDFIALELLVFDRWGNQILQDEGADLEWNGKMKEEFVAQGVYIFVLKYLNTLTGKEEQVSTDVMIVR